MNEMAARRNIPNPTNRRVRQPGGLHLSGEQPRYQDHDTDHDEGKQRMGDELSHSARNQAEFTRSHWRAMREFVLVGLTAIIAGGLVAAVTGPTGFDEGSWVAAYLVLVAGVAQVGLGVGQALLTDGTVPGRLRVVQLLAYNLANSAVLGGTLTGSVTAVAAGGVLLLISLTLFLATARHARPRTWYLVLYRIVIASLAVSVPVGVVVSVIRHS